MRLRLTDKVVRELPFAERGSKLTFDSELTGFAVRSTVGAKAFVLNTRIDGRLRQPTIGSYPEWTTALARAEAARLKREIDLGNDPLREREEARTAPRMRDLARLYLSEYAIPYKAEKSVYDDRLLLRRFVDPLLTLRGPVEDAPKPYRVDRTLDRDIAKSFGDLRVRSVTSADTDRLHQRITMSGRPVTANRLNALFSNMFNFAERRGLRERGSNPCRGGPRNAEHKRKRVLNDTQLAELLRAIAEHPQRTAADAIMLALLTGARQGELLRARWPDIDFDRSIWRKPFDNTKEDEDRFVPLAVLSLRLLEDRRAEATSQWIFPGRRRDQPLTSVKKAWRAICSAAGIPCGRRETGYVAHDLRHQFASVAVSGGASLAMIGGLLGHSQVQTTQRYSHLFTRPLREVSDAVGRQLISVANKDKQSGS
jgi:integrase